MNTDESSRSKLIRLTYIDKLKRFIDTHELWLDDKNKQKNIYQRIFRISETIKRLLNIQVHHDASMSFGDFIKITVQDNVWNFNEWNDAPKSPLI